MHFYTALEDFLFNFFLYKYCIELYTIHTTISIIVFVIL
jgi:hypothetical protein